MNQPCILIVEDEPIIGIDLKNTLMSLGYDVPVVIPSGEEALQKVTELNPDLILMDIYLSGEMDGIEATKRIQESYDIPVIYLTAHTEETAFTRARETSPYGFLVKPTGRSDLFTAVETALNRHELEIRMQESEKKYREMVENINDVIYTLDKNGDVTYISPVIEQISKYTVDELIGRNFSEFIHTNDLTEIREGYLRTIAGTREPSEYRMLDKDGSIRYVRTSSSAIIRDGELTGINGIMTDITDKKKTEEELNRSQRILESIARTVPNILYRLDASDKIVFINDAVKEYGYNPEEVTGKDIMEFVHPDDREKAKHRVNERRTRERRTRNLEIRLFSKRQTEAAADEQVERVFLVHCEGLYTSEKPRAETFMGSQGIAYDITDQKQTQDALRESEEKYRELVQSANSIILRMDSQGSITFINEYAQHFFDYSEDELIGKNVVGTIVPETETTGRDLREMIIDIGKHPEKYINNENENIRKNGERVWISWTNKPIRDEKGQVTELLCIGNDITEKKIVNERIRESELRFHILFDISPQAIALTEMETGTLIDVNETFCKLTGFRKDEVIGKRTTDSFYSEDDRKRFIEKLLKNGEVHGLEMDFRAKDGSVLNSYMYSKILELRGKRVVFTVFLDVTEQKRAEDTLRKSEEKYRHIFENIQDVYYETSADGIILELSPSIETFSQYRREELIGKSLYEIYVAPEERDILQKTKQSSPTESVHDYLIRLKDKDGSVYYCSINSKSVRDKHGNPLKNVGSLRDITERRKIEEALLESEQKYRELVEDLNDVIYAVDLEGTITYISPAVQSLFGYTPEELIGKNFLPYVYEEDRDRIVEGFMRSLQDIHQPADYRMITKSGALRWFRVFERTILDGDKPVGTRGVLTDITEKKKKEKELQESEEKYRLVSENIPVAVYSALPDEHSTSLFISGRIDDLTGYTAEQFITDPDLWLEVVHPDDRASVLEKLEEHRTKKIPLDVEYRIVTRDNEIKWIKDKATPFIDDGRIVRIDGFMEDITEKKLAEDKIRESLAEKEILLKEVHHRVKNNFQIIMSLLQLQTKSAPDKHVIEALRDSQNRIRSMALVHEKLYQSEDFARINFSEYINIMTRELYQSYFCDPKRIRLQVNMAEVYLEISKAIPCGLIINELVSNAIKHAFNDNQKKCEITLGLKEKGNTIILTISDNGRGIPDTINIKEPETLGLKLVSTLVKNQLKGELELKSKGGTEFVVRF